MIPAKPAARVGQVPFWRLFSLLRRDLLSALPERLYRAWMAEFRAPFLRSYLVNDPGLVAEVLRRRPGDFPKSGRVTAGLRPLLGQAVFLASGADWVRQRRLIDPAFASLGPDDYLPTIKAAADAMAERIADGAQDIEAAASRGAADVIFRLLFSASIDAPLAAEVFERFGDYQRTQPVVSAGGLLTGRRAFRWPGWRERRSVRAIREPVAGLVRARLREIRHCDAPNDLATRLLTARDPRAGKGFSETAMIDQVAIFFLAGHETSAAALGWALYLLAHHPEHQEQVAGEGASFLQTGSLRDLGHTRDVFRETLRLYPPVPMMVREALREELFRGRRVPRGAQIVISPWHLHRQTRLWPRPDAFDPDRWSDGACASVRDAAYLPFSTGPRCCPGRGLAMAEGCVFLATLAARFRIRPVAGRDPVPVAHLTVRSKDGIWLEFSRRSGSG